MALVVFLLTYLDECSGRMAMMLLMSSVLSASRYLVDKFVQTELMDVDLIAGAQERMPFLIELLLGVRADALAS